MRRQQEGTGCVRPRLMQRRRHLRMALLHSAMVLGIAGAIAGGVPALPAGQAQAFGLSDITGAVKTAGGAAKAVAKSAGRSVKRGAKAGFDVGRAIARTTRDAALSATADAVTPIADAASRVATIHRADRDEVQRRRDVAAGMNTIRNLGKSIDERLPDFRDPFKPGTLTPTGAGAARASKVRHGRIRHAGRPAFRSGPGPTFPGRRKWNKSPSSNSAAGQAGAKRPSRKLPPPRGVWKGAKGLPCTATYCRAKHVPRRNSAGPLSRKPQSKLPPRRSAASKGFGCPYGKKCASSHQTTPQRKAPGALQKGRNRKIARDRSVWGRPTGVKKNRRLTRERRLTRDRNAKRSRQLTRERRISRSRKVRRQSRRANTRRWQRTERRRMSRSLRRNSRMKRGFGMRRGNRRR